MPTICITSRRMVGTQPARAQTPALADLPAALKPAGLSVYLEVPATGAWTMNSQSLVKNWNNITARQTTRPR